jgi:hypothetical protein
MLKINISVIRFAAKFVSVVYVQHQCNPVCSKPCANSRCTAPETCSCNLGFSKDTLLKRVRVIQVSPKMLKINTNAIQVAASLVSIVNVQLQRLVHVIPVLQKMLKINISAVLFVIHLVSMADAQRQRHVRVTPDFPKMAKIIISAIRFVVNLVLMADVQLG